MRTMDRYLIKEVALVFAATLLVLLAMVLSHRLGGYLNQAAGGLLSRSAIFALIGLQAIRYLVVLIPLASLLAIMLSLARLHRDSEIVAATACGFGPGALYRPMFMLAVPLTVLMTALSLYVVPLSMELLYELQNRARQDAEVSIFTPGVFREAGDGIHVIYVGKILDQGQGLGEIFVRSFTREGIAITTAKRGYQEIDANTGVRYIVLQDGRRYVGSPGRGDYQSVRFERLTVRIDTEVKQEKRRREALPTAQLLQMDTTEARVEWHERLSGPISLLLVAFVAPLIAHAQPREGRYGRVVAAILVYTIYINLLGVGQTWLEQERVPPLLGLWWAHGLLLLFGIIIWWRRYGFPGLRGHAA